MRFRHFCALIALVATVFASGCCFRRCSCSPGPLFRPCRPACC